MGKMNGNSLKAEWMMLDPSNFEPLTFGELGVGNRFIFLPMPGDNHGHGGLRCAQRFMVKTAMVAEDIAPELPHGIPTGQAADGRNVIYDLPNYTLVIKVDLV